MRTSIPPLLLFGVAAGLALGGCAGPSADTASAGKTPAPSVPSAAYQAVAHATPVREDNGQLVTLADLTGHEPTYGQTTDLADSTPGEMALGASDSPGGVPNDSGNLEIVTSSLRDKLAVLRVGAGRSDSNLLSVFAGLKNKTGHLLELELQTVYRDKEGRPLEDGRGSWVPITLKPHEETQYRSIALSEDATDFLVRIRHAPPPSGN